MNIMSLRLIFELLNPRYGISIIAALELLRGVEKINPDLALDLRKCINGIPGSDGICRVCISKPDHERLLKKYVK